MTFSIRNDIHQKNMMKRLSLALLVMVSVAVSCKKDDPGSPFAGKWSGGYTGSDVGMWRVTVHSDGKITGTANSLRTSREFPLEGSISDRGDFKASFGIAATGSEFTGTFTKDGSATGTWKNTMITPAIEGTWQGQRE